MPDDRRTEALSALREARRSLDEAVALERASFPGPALRSAYYAMFHAARALLLSEGVRARTHRGVLSEISLRFVRGGRIPAELFGEMSRALSDRLKADYEEGIVITDEHAERSVESATAFVDLTSKLLDS